MHVSKYVMKRILGIYQLADPNDDAIPILPIDDARIERFKIKWPRLYDKKDLEQARRRHDSIAYFLIPYRSLDSDQSHLDEFVHDLKTFDFEAFLQKYQQQPPVWYEIHLAVISGASV